MSDIADRLRASVKYDAINGDPFERSVCANQMIEAAKRISDLENIINYTLDIKSRCHCDDYAYDDCWQKMRELI